MPQLSVADEPGQAYEGKVQNGGSLPTSIVSGIAASLIYFGKAVGSANADLGLPKTVALLAAGVTFQGIAIADPSIEQIPGNDFGSFADETGVPVMRKGRIWVVSADAVDDLSKGVFVREATPGGSPPADSLGSFRATAAADHIDLSASMAWVAGTTIGGAEFGLLEINLP